MMLVLASAVPIGRQHGQQISTGTRVLVANRTVGIGPLLHVHPGRAPISMVRCAHEGGGYNRRSGSAGGGGSGDFKPPGSDSKRHGGLLRQGGALIRRLNDTLGVRPFRDLDQIRNIREHEIGGRLWLLLLTFYGIYYGAYLYLVYKILQSLPGVMPALEQADDKTGWLLGALLDVGLWPRLAAALLLYIKAGVGHREEGAEDV